MDSRSILIFLMLASLFVGCFVYFVSRLKETAPPKKSRRSANDTSIRSADRMKLSKDESHVREKAEKLIASGSVLEGAVILESLGLQRFAVAALESAGMIDDACAILIRMQRPNRAAAVCFRNSKFKKAGQYFLAAGMKAEAAHAFCESGLKDTDDALKAVGLFENLKMHEDYFKALARTKQHKIMVRTCIAKAAWDPLIQYFQKRDCTEVALGFIELKSIPTIVSALPAEMSHHYAHWCQVRKDFDFFQPFILAMDSKPNAHTFFWAAMPAEAANEAVQALLNAPAATKVSLRPQLEKSARGLYEAKQYGLAAVLYETSKRRVMAAKCWVAVGDLDRALVLLKGSQGSAAFASKLQEYMAQFQPVQSGTTRTWPQEACSIATRVLDNVDPEEDERESSSPFQLGIAG